MAGPSLKAAVLGVLVLVILPAMPSAADVHNEPDTAVPGTWFTVNATGQHDFDLGDITITLIQNGKSQETTVDSDSMNIVSEFKDENGSLAYRIYAATNYLFYLNWIVCNKSYIGPRMQEPGIKLTVLIHEAGMKNVTVKIAGLRGGAPAEETFNIRSAKMDGATVNFSRTLNESVTFEYYPDSVSTVYQRETIGIYGIGFVGNVVMTVAGKDGPILERSDDAYSYLEVQNWYVSPNTELGFYNITVEGTDINGNQTSQRMEVQVAPPCPNFPACIGNPPPRHKDHDIDWLMVSLSVIVLSVTMAALFTRLRRASLLNQAMRAKIYAAIEKQQGIHFHELMRVLEVKPGVLSHHINILEKEKFIKSLQDGTYRRFFLYESNMEMRVALNHIQEKILELVRRKPGIFQKDISREIGSSGFVTNYHVRILRDAGMVTLEREGKNIRCFPSASP